MTTIIYKNPSAYAKAFRENWPNRTGTSLFLVKNNTDIPIYGFKCNGSICYIIKNDGGPVLIEDNDVVELRT